MPAIDYSPPPAIVDTAPEQKSRPNIYVANPDIRLAIPPPNLPAKVQTTPKGAAIPYPTNMSRIYIAAESDFSDSQKQLLDSTASFLLHLWRKSGDPRADILPKVRILLTDPENGVTADSAYAEWDKEANAIRLPFDSEALESPVGLAVALGHETSHALSLANFTPTGLIGRFNEERRAHNVSAGDARLIASHFKSRNDVPEKRKARLIKEAEFYELYETASMTFYALKRTLLQIAHKTADKQTIIHLQELAEKDEFFKRDIEPMRNALRNGSCVEIFIDGRSTNLKAVGNRILDQHIAARKKLKRLFMSLSRPEAKEQKLAIAP